MSKQSEDGNALVAAAPSWMQPENLGEALAVAERISKSGILPDAFRGNAGSVLLVMDFAQRCRMPLLSFFQKTYVVHGKLGFEYPLLLSMLAQAGYRAEWESEGAERQALTIVRPDGSRCPTMEWTAERAQNFRTWTKDKSGKKSQSSLWEKWQREGKDPETMLAARATSFAVRKYAPEILGGGDCYVVDELEEMKPADVTVKDERPAVQGVEGVKRTLGVGEKVLPGDDAEPESADFGDWHVSDDVPDSAAIGDVWVRKDKRAKDGVAVKQLDDDGTWRPAKPPVRAAVLARRLPTTGGQ